MERTDEQDPRRLADELEEQTDELGRRSEALGERVTEVRRDWEGKRSDPSVPGATPAEGGDDQTAEGESPAKEAPPEDAGSNPPDHAGDDEKT